jgi:predicted house-cleaning noncanonical NTP pyrophosphatase (MazG superfamily)
MAFYYRYSYRVVTKDLIAMHKFQQNKLWRDNLPARMEAMGSIIHTKHLSDAEYDAELRSKLLEEVEEVRASHSAEALLQELADLCEVVDAFCVLHGITKEQLIAAQIKKREDRGGFYGRTYVTLAEHPAGSFGEQYCRAQPEKYPEVE